MIKNKYINNKLRKSAKDQACVCHGSTSTTVWAHSNESKHGKGMGTKAHDIFGAYLCYQSHVDYDTMSERDFFYKYGQDKQDWFRTMWERSLIVACEKGHV